MNLLPVESSCWEFSVEIYRREGVAEACLWLQDRHGLDVNFLLFLIWAGLGRGRLDDELFARALGFSREWSRNVVAGLRAVRRWLKATGCGALPPADRGSCLSLRGEIVERERAAEKLQQLVLEGMAGELPAADRNASATEKAARGNVRRYLAALAIEPDEAIASRIETILGSALG